MGQQILFQRSEDLAKWVSERKILVIELVCAKLISIVFYCSDGIQIIMCG